MKKANEVNAIEAVRKICARTGMLPIDGCEIRYPDEETRNQKEVDCLIVAGKTKLAIEHSIIEFYSGQLEYINSSYDFISQVNKQLKGVLSDKWHYTALIPPELMIGKKKSELKALSEAIIVEIKKGVEKLEPKVNLVFEFLGKKITIFCEYINGLENGRIYRAPTSPTNQLDVMIAGRVKKLFDEKLDKLIRYHFLGYKTVLAVEDISGRHMFGINRQSMGTWNYFKTLFLVDIVIILVSNQDEMVVGNIWKRGFRWPKHIPLQDRFSISEI